MVIRIICRISDFEVWLHLRPHCGLSGCSGTALSLKQTPLGAWTVLKRKRTILMQVVLQPNKFPISSHFFPKFAEAKTQPHWNAIVKQRRSNLLNLAVLLHDITIVQLCVVTMHKGHMCTGLKWTAMCLEQPWINLSFHVPWLHAPKRVPPETCHSTSLSVPPLDKQTLFPPVLSQCSLLSPRSVAGYTARSE